MLKGGQNSGQLAPRGVHVSTQVYGKAVKLVYGLNQITPDLVWYNDWEVDNSPTNGRLFTVTGGSSKKKGGKKGNIHYYSAAVDFLFGHAPILGILSAWYNNQRLGCIIGSASGFISGGSFSFSPQAGDSLVVLPETVPSSPAYVITVPNFVSDGQTTENNTGVYDNTMGRWLVSSDPSLPPGPNQYTVDGGGNYTFDAAQAGHSVNIRYRKLGSAGDLAILAGIVAVTVNEAIPPTTFNDYGAPSGITMAGHWDRPLWNSRFAVPGRVDSEAFRARDPYSFHWDGYSAEVTFPADLEGYPVTVYYAVPVINKSNGNFYSSTITPLALLNLEFENSCGSGSEYTNHPEQQVINKWCAGAGSTRFDFGASNAMPNLLLEAIGAFTCWPNGDCDVADVVTDIVLSGPVLGAGL